MKPKMASALLFQGKAKLIAALKARRASFSSASPSIWSSSSLLLLVEPLGLVEVLPVMLNWASLMPLPPGLAMLTHPLEDTQPLRPHIVRGHGGLRTISHVLSGEQPQLSSRAGCSREESRRMYLVPSIIYPCHNPDGGGGELVPIHSELLLSSPALLGLLEPEGSAFQLYDGVEPVFRDEIVRILG